MTRLVAIASRLIVLCALVALTALVVPADGQQPTPLSPADGHTIHVTAPHVVDGEIMGPYHHCCKVLSPEPVIECLCYGSSEPGARLEQVEYIVAKSHGRSSEASVMET